VGREGGKEGIGREGGREGRRKGREEKRKRREREKLAGHYGSGPKMSLLSRANSSGSFFPPSLPTYLPTYLPTSLPPPCSCMVQIRALRAGFRWDL
jgi:hypothetical protein